MEADIIPLELRRMFLGEQPLLFYLELLIRTLIIYFYTILLIRWIGGRSIGQLSMVEFVLVIALGSAVGDAMFYPEVPLLAAMGVITIVIGINKLLDMIISRSNRVEQMIDGRPVVLVKDGVILDSGIGQSRLSRNEIKALLRIAGVENLGQVRWAFLETSGEISVFRQNPPQDGESIVPPDDIQTMAG